MAAIEYRGANAVTNFDISSYADRLKTKALLSVPDDQDDHNPAPQQPKHNFSVQEDEGEEEEETEEKQVALVQLQPQLPPNLCYDLSHPNSMDSSDMEHDPWSLCFDPSVFNHLSVPNLIPLEKAGDHHLPDYMFNSDCKSFDDNIDFMMFDVPTSNETTSDYFNPDSLFETSAGGFDMEADSFVYKEEDEEEKAQRVSGTSPHSSSSSTTTT